jgi:hypothetical protein
MRKHFTQAPQRGNLRFGVPRGRQRDPEDQHGIIEGVDGVGREIVVGPPVNGSNTGTCCLAPIMLLTAPP